MKPLSKQLRSSKTWNAWRSMKERCNNPAHSSYKNYGARGISYDPHWEDFETFVADMGKCPERVDPLSLDRVDNNGDYSKDNCRWATRSQQTFNSRTRSDNSSSLRGVYKEHSTMLQWIANFVLNGQRTILYKGSDFFEACCARKAWETKYVRGKV